MTLLLSLLPELDTAAPATSVRTWPLCCCYCGHGLTLLLLLLLLLLPQDLTDRARQGKLDPVVGRDEELRRVVHILCRRTKNNPVLVGESGVVSVGG